MIRAGDGATQSVARVWGARITLDVLKRAKRNAREVAVDRQPKLQRQLPFAIEGFLCEIKLHVYIAAARDKATLERRAMRQQPDQPRACVALIDLPRARAMGCASGTSGVTSSSILGCIPCSFSLSRYTLLGAVCGLPGPTSILLSVKYARAGPRAPGWERDEAGGAIGTVAERRGRLPAVLASGGGYSAVSGGERQMSVSDVEFRAVLGRFPTGVTVVTTCEGKAPVGVTVIAFASISLDPPLVMVSIDKRSHLHVAIPQAAYFAASILTAEQQDLSRRFAGQTGDRPTASVA